MVEFHINDCECFLYLMRGTHYGGFLSVKFTEGQRTEMNIGHDEGILKQNISPKSWTGPDRKALLIPRYKSIRIMISDFKSREFGFGLAWDDI